MGIACSQQLQATGKKVTKSNSFAWFEEWFEEEGEGEEGGAYSDVLYKKLIGPNAHLPPRGLNF